MTATLADEASFVASTAEWVGLPAAAFRLVQALNINIAMMNRLLFLINVNGFMVYFIESLLFVPDGNCNTKGSPAMRGAPVL